MAKTRMFWIFSALGMFLASAGGLELASAATPTSFQSARLTNVNSGLVVDVEQSSKADGAPIIQWPDHQGANQRWNIAESTRYAGYVSVRNVNSGKCISVGSDLSAGADLVQLTCSDSARNLWKIVAGNGGYQFINRGTSQAMEIGSFATTQGVAVQQYRANGGKNQLFAITTGSSLTTTVPSSPSGQVAPVGDIAGWRQTFVEDFKSTATASAFDKTYVNSWCGYADGTGGKYYKSTISAHDGLMDFSLDGTKGAAGSYGQSTNYCATLYGRYSIRFKVIGASGYGTAMMLWPNSNKWGDGEIDYPEGNFNSTMHVFQHGVGCADCSAADGFNTGVTFTDWHTATTEWLPTGVKYYLDGKLIKSTTTNVPINNHRQTIQMAPTSSPATSGHLLVDWVAQWAPK